MLRLERSLLAIAQALDKSWKFEDLSPKTRVVVFRCTNSRIGQYSQSSNNPWFSFRNLARNCCFTNDAEEMILEAGSVYTNHRGQMKKKIDIALYSVLRAYAARVYESPKLKKTAQSEQASPLKASLLEQNSSTDSKKTE